MFLLVCPTCKLFLGPPCVSHITTAFSKILSVCCEFFCFFVLSRAFFRCQQRFTFRFSLDLLALMMDQFSAKMGQ